MTRNAVTPRRSTVRGRQTSKAGRVRFAVVGAGHIAQHAVIPAFSNARAGCELTTIFSGDPRKRSRIQRTYRVPHALDYPDFNQACEDGLFDAVYIALPNDMHREYTERAAARGIHVLCEKPMAITSHDALAMVRATREANVRLMIAYRLHFEPANLSAIKLIRQGRIGPARLFSSSFTMQVKPHNIRVEARHGGGPLYDLGVYCINAARYLFGSSPVEVCAYATIGEGQRFAEIEESLSAVMRFPGDRLATFTCSFGAADASWYQVIGAKGDICVDSAYEYAAPIRMQVTVNNRTRTTTFAKRDQFAPELLYFAKCVRTGREPEPGGMDGLIDVHIIEALRESARSGRSVRLGALPRERSPRPEQAMHKPPVEEKGELVGAASAHR